MQRFDILRSANLIDDEVYQAIYSAKQQLLAWQVACDVPQVEMLLTHLAMALMRIRQGKAESQGLDDELMQEILSSPNYTTLNGYHQSMLDLIHQILPDLAVPAAEESYFLANLYALSLAQPHAFT